MSDFQIENGELVEYTGEGWGCGDPGFGYIHRG